MTVTEPTPNTFNLAFQIPTGEPLKIDVTYASITDMNNNTSPTPAGYTPNTFDLAVIQSAEAEENTDNAKLYLYNGTAWIFVSDLSGAKGETGDTGATGPMPNHQWDGTSLRFELPEGGYGDYVDLKGDTGASLDTGVENTITTLPNLNSLANQKQINEYLEINKVNVQSLSSNILVYPTLTDSTVIPAYYQMIDDLDALLSATDVHTTNDLTSTGTSLITGNNSLVGSFIVDSNLFIGNPGVIGVTTIGNIKKVSDATTANAEFYFTLSKYNTVTEVETLLSTSGTTATVSSLAYEQFSETALLNNGAFLETDLIVIKYYANKVGVQSDPIYAFQFGGANPVRTLLPVPVSVLPLDNKVNKSGDTITGDLTVAGNFSVGDGSSILSVNEAGTVSTSAT